MKFIIKEHLAYELDGRFEGYCIEILKDEETTEVFLYHKQYGVKSLMFGLSNNFQTDLMLRDLIANNLEEEIAMYTEKFIDDHYYENKI